MLPQIVLHSRPRRVQSMRSDCRLKQLGGDPTADRPPVSCVRSVASGAPATSPAGARCLGGDLRESNSRKQGHNLLPKPLGQGHTRTIDVHEKDHVHDIVNMGELDPGGVEPPSETSLPDKLYVRIAEELLRSSRALASTNHLHQVRSSFAARPSGPSGLRQLSDQMTTTRLIGVIRMIATRGF